MESVQVKDKSFDLFISEEVIIDKIEALARHINEDLANTQPLFVCVLNGAFMFASDLMKRVKIPCEISFIRLKSYQGTCSEGKVREINGLAESVEDRNVVIVEDIIDTGVTIKYLIEKLKRLNPASVKIATLFLKPDALKTDVTPNYVAMEIPNDFIVGYGLDYDGFGRNLRNIYKIKSC
ncbi:MAG: hypoxanthine phosphoribosyltransferase [Dysgonamonadaceae bacterium]|jgi:hypoxanthine phosphoribosyltransferase|nr:hypoxanthine phosphoribosyltransferase [Dysgonamonadaceae bacterium]